MEGFLSRVLGKALLITYAGSLQFRCLAEKSLLLGSVDGLHTCIVGEALLISPTSGFLSCLESMARP